VARCTGRQRTHGDGPRVATVSPAGPHPLPPGAGWLLRESGGLGGGQAVAVTRDLSDLRESYQRRGLRRADLAPAPIAQFERWWDEWLATEPYDAAACVLATAGADGTPSARFVLCRGVDAEGFAFYTNQESRKAEELRANPRAALTFGWSSLARQVRIEGPVSIVDADVADAYWASRPRGSQLGAWASDQSEVVGGRTDLDRRQAEAEARFGAGDDGDVIPRPPFWGGYRVGVRQAEFWQGQPSRLHDRFRYRGDELEPGRWQIDRLAP
jgi:pyridoxamine 5'-phosphate oxidase